MDTVRRKFCRDGIFAGGCILDRPPPLELWFIYIWPAVSLPLTIVSFLRLRLAYREEPGGFAGNWHLSIGDFYATIAFTALLMALAQASWPTHFVPVGAFFSVLLGVGFLGCILVATRKGFVKNTEKWFSAFGMLLKTIGLMGVGLYAVYFGIGLILLLLQPQVIFFSEFLNNMLNVFDTRVPVPFLVIRGLLICLPIGVVMTWFVDRDRVRRTAKKEP